jgi:two-component system OmpR family sensor kinase
MSSLRARLLAWLLAGVVFIGAAGGWIVYRNALSEADAFFDYHLRQTALILRDQPVEYLLAPQFPPADAAYDFVVQVWSLDGVRVYLSRPHAVLPQITTLGFATVATREGRWRVFGVQALTKVIQVAQPMSVRQQRAAELALHTLKPFALLLPVLALLIWLAVGHALEPLQRLTALVKARRVDALDTLPDTRLPDEVQPLVSALNDLLTRLRAALERERAFMADAAHELRTPLTALHLQMGMLARASGDAERAAASLDDLAREIVAELVPLADAGRIDLGVSAAQPASVRGDPDALRTLLRNLVDNAVRYTPAGGRVDVSVVEEAAGDTRGARLTVSDDGPGIPDAERARVFDRFYRRAGTAPPGSGLGLSIVKTIAAAHGATLTLAQGPAGKGLAVTVSFSAHAAPPQAET